MGKVTGFLEFDRIMPSRRPVEERVKDWKEVYLELPEAQLHTQAARCMDCGVPFCQKGCPVDNLIPEWNDLVFHGRWKEAYERLRSTNNFPEFTGRICPAPCEGSCVLGINSDAVTIRHIEVTIAENAFSEGWANTKAPETRTGRKVAVIGSGPAGLAAAEQLNSSGHTVTVFERDDRIGGLLRYGIPEFKMEKRILDRRLALMEQAGVAFRTKVHVGVDVSTEELRRDFDAILLCIGSTVPRDLTVPGRELNGIHFAMDYLTPQNKQCEGDQIEPTQVITAKDKRVVIIGGGDTGADCLGTAHRQGASSVLQLELMPRPPAERAFDNPWPQWPQIFRVSSAHEEGGDRDYAVATRRFFGDGGRVCGIEAVRLEFVRDPQTGRNEMKEVPGTEMRIDADLVLLAMGFVGPEKTGLLTELQVGLDGRGNINTDKRKRTNVPGVFAAGDAARGQSLVVWAIREGRDAAQEIDSFLLEALP